MKSIDEGISFNDVFIAVKNGKVASGSEAILV